MTFRTAAGEASIREMASKVPSILVGAGTVTSVEVARRAVDAGARYIVTPGYDRTAVKWCIDHEVPIPPGTATPGEIEDAQNHGLAAVKFFPAEVNGGVPTLKALAGPYGSMRFVPTGGIGPSNLTSYLSQPNVLACGGSWLAPKDLVAQGRFDEIREICRRSSYAMHGFELAHVGINCDDAAEAKEVATSFATLFGLPVYDKGGGCFASDMVDVVKGRLLGERGHIGVSCVDVDRAKAWFERRGYRSVEKGANRDERGYTSVFLEGEVGGFAVRLRRR